MIRTGAAIQAALETEAAALTALLATVDADLGQVPRHARRPRYAHEVAAAVNFATLDDAYDQAAAALIHVARSERRTLTLLLADEAARRARTHGAAAARDWLLHVARPDASIAMNLAGYPDWRTAAVETHRLVLRDAALAAARTAAGEAATQGVPVAPAAIQSMPRWAEAELGDLAQRAVDEPTSVLLRRAADLGARIPTQDPDRWTVAARAMYENDQAGEVGLVGSLPQSTAAVSLGRQAAQASLPPATRYYASELLDRNTCVPCAGIDGREYPSLDAARMDYPIGGGHWRCEGGHRCRGTLVAVFPSEAPPTLAFPFQTV